MAIVAAGFVGLIVPAVVAAASLVKNRPSICLTCLGLPGFVGQQSSGVRIDDVESLAGKAMHAFIAALPVGRLFFLGIPLDIQARCGATKEEGPSHGFFLRPRKLIWFVPDQHAFKFGHGQRRAEWPAPRGAQAGWPRRPGACRDLSLSSGSRRRFVHSRRNQQCRSFFRLPAQLPSAPCRDNLGSHSALVRGRQRRCDVRNAGRPCHHTLGKPQAGLGGSRR